MNNELVFIVSEDVFHEEIPDAGGFSLRGSFISPAVKIVKQHEKIINA